MSHPFQAQREDKIQHSRVGHITKGYANGGGVEHVDPAQDRKLVKSMSNEHEKDMKKVEGRKNGGRLDRFARGGKVSSKGTNVNVIITPGSGGQDHPPAIPIPVSAGAAAPPPMPPRPPMMQAGIPPGIGGPGGAPGAPMIRRDGGRAGYKRGGAVKDGPAWKEGLRNGTSVEHSPGKNDITDIKRPKQITYKTGGRIEATGMGPKMKAGAEGGEGRLEKIGIQKRSKRP